jgi:hypothetical protein
MRVKVSILSILLVSAGAVQGTGREITCKSRREIVGECFKTHGRLRTYNGIGSVIWQIGTDRELAVGEQELPSVLKEAGDYGVDHFGDFEVCPLTKQREGEMQWVCVESVSNVVEVDHRPEDKGKKAIVRKIDGGNKHN